MQLLIKLLYCNNKLKLATALTLYYYKTMKSIESKFRYWKNVLLSVSPRSCEVDTLFGSAKVSTLAQAELNYDKLLKVMDAKDVLEKSILRVNLIRKSLGNKFDSVVKSWYDDKQVLFVIK